MKIGRNADAAMLLQFVVSTLDTLVQKQVWADRRQWEGFLICAKETAPKSFPALLRLPRAALEEILGRMPDMRPPLLEFASRPEVSRSLPRITIQVLQGTAPPPEPTPAPPPQQQQQQEVPQQQQEAPQPQRGEETTGSGRAPSPPRR